MFCLDPIHPLFTATLDIVSEEPGLSVAELHERLKKKNISVTLQHLYRTLNRLIDEQLLIKSKGRLSVNMMWLSYLQFYAERGKAVIRDRARAANPFPFKEGERRVYEVDTLVDLQAVWQHLLVELHAVAPEKYLFKYYSHAWWQIGKHALSPEFYVRIKEEGIRCLWLFGNDTFLDRLAGKRHKDVMDARLTDEEIFPREGYNLNVYGEYIFECIFPEKLAKHFGFFFKTVGSEKEFEEELFDDLFVAKHPLKLTVWRNKKQSDGMRAKIERCFLKPELS